METIISIKKNKPEFKALISWAKELEKQDKSISVNTISEKSRQKCGPLNITKK